LQSLQDPVGFEEQKAQARATWTFSSGEEQDEDELADWWKTAD